MEQVSVYIWDSLHVCEPSSILYVLLVQLLRVVVESERLQVMMGARQEYTLSLEYTSLSQVTTHAHSHTHWHLENLENPEESHNAIGEYVKLHAESNPMSGYLLVLKDTLWSVNIKKLL